MARGRNLLSTKYTEKRDLKVGLHHDGGGLYLQVSKFETKSWVYRFMIAGRARNMGLGSIESVALKDARKKRDAAYLLVVDGTDPIDDRSVRKAALAVEKAKTLTFKECAEKYIAVHSPSWKSPKHAPQWRASLENYAYPTIGKLPVASVDVTLVLGVLEPIWATKTETASRVRGRIETILSWARARGYRHGENPATWRGHLDQLLPARSQVAPVEHHPALAYAELPAFMVKLRAKRSVSARALEWTILSAARTGDTTGATWSEIDKAEQVWTVPAGRLKGRKGARKRDHVVPLTTQALAVLDALPKDSDFVFPGGKKDVGLSNAAMSELLKGMGYLPDVATIHGFRSTFKDWAAEQTSHPNELSEMAMAHVVSDRVEAAYRRGDMREKRRKLMEDWSAFCDGQSA